MKPIVAVFGGNRIGLEIAALAESLGRRLVDEGYRIVCGGLGGVMAAVACGARTSAAWTGSEVIGILPGWTADEQPNPWVDIALKTDMGSMRNTLIARVADAALAIAGGAGTLSEVALAWHEGRPLGALSCTGGWSARLAGEQLDDRRQHPIEDLGSVDAAIHWLDALFPRGVLPTRGPTCWWHEQIPCLHRIHDGEPRGARVIQAQLGMSLALDNVWSRLEALAQRVRQWNLKHGQARRALVSIDHGYADCRLLEPVFERLSELQPVVFVTGAQLDGDSRPPPLTALYAWCADQHRDPHSLTQVFGFDRHTLKALPEAEQRARLDAAGIPLEPPRETMLEVKDLEALQARGWLVGSYGPGRLDLDKLSASERSPRLVNIRRQLGIRGGVPWLAWPERCWTPNLVQLARRSGFALQFGLNVDVDPKLDAVHPADLILRRRWT